MSSIPGVSRPSALTKPVGAVCWSLAQRGAPSFLRITTACRPGANEIKLKLHLPLLVPPSSFTRFHGLPQRPSPPSSHISHRGLLLKAPAQGSGIPLPPSPGFPDTKAEGEGAEARGAEAAADAVLKAGIADFYNESSQLWEDMWGEHMHHGYYETASASASASASSTSSGQDRGAGGGAETRGMVRHQEAQIRMIEKSLEFAGVPGPGSADEPRRVLDVGCGIGGSARYLGRKYPGAEVTGITLSPRQALRGNELCIAAGLQNRVSLQVADAMSTPFPDSSFDLLWSMESGEHMPNKRQFVQELTRLAAPGGKIIIVTWCHRNLDKAAGEIQLEAWEELLLDKICDAYYLPAWCSADNYLDIARDLGLKNVRAQDWTEFVTPFWPAVIASALSWRGLVGLFRAGWTTMRGALAMFLMVQGFNSGVIKFAIVTADK